jgi:hypothetical protein
VLYRLAGQPAVTSSTVFSDVPPNRYYTSAVSWANANNIVTGYEGKFMPDTLITREQMAVILYRYAAFAGFGAPYANTAAFDSFSDKASVSGYAAEAVKWAAYNSLLSGVNGKILPNNTASRAEVAQIILNYCQKFTGT